MIIIKFIKKIIKIIKKFLRYLINSIAYRFFRNFMQNITRFLKFNITMPKTIE